MIAITVADMEQRLEDLQYEREDLLQRAAALEKKMAAFRLVIDEYSADMERPEISLSGMSLEDALVALARHHDGELSTYQARPVLMDAGLLKGEPRAISLQLYHTLNNSDHFVSAEARGRYRLVSSAQPARVISFDDLELD